MVILDIIKVKGITTKSEKMKDNKIWNKIRNISSLKDLSHIGIANIGGGAISSIFWLYLASIMTPEEYGQIGYLIAIGGIAAVFCQFGTGHFLTVTTAKKQNVLPIIALISISSSFIAAIVLYILFKEPALGIIAIGYVVFNLGLSDLFGRRFYRKYTKIFLIQKILLVVLGLSMYYFIGPIGIIYGFGLSMLIFSYQIYVSIKGMKLDYLILKNKIGFALNTYLEDIVKTFSSESHKFIIAPLLGFALLGNFNLGMQSIAALGIIPGIVSQYIIPEEASGSTKLQLKKYYLALATIIAILGFFLAPIVILELFPKFNSALEIVPILSLTIIPGSINSIFYSKFLASEKSKFIIISTLLFMTLQISLMVILGESIGITGIAYAFLIAMSSQTVILGLFYKLYIK